MRASYEIAGSGPDVVFIRDTALQTGNMSVTNDAEAVVQEVLRDFPGKRIVYRDTAGRWDELCHDGAKFIRFSAYEGYHP